MFKYLLENNDTKIILIIACLLIGAWCTMMASTIAVSIIHIAQVVAQ
jgi:hypothetical protein